MKTEGQIEDLITLSLSDVCKALRKKDKRLSLSSIDNYLQDVPDYPGKIFGTIEGSWVQRNRWTGEEIFTLKLSSSIGKDREGLFISLSYSFGGRQYQGEHYYLTRRESNLKPGTYRYYFIDPYWEKEGEICSKLYFLPQIGEFVSRKILRSYGYLYKEQTKGKKDRFLFSYKKAPEGKELKYRKSHYRGRITPFWRRFEYLCDREEEREKILLFSWGNTKGIYSSELERDCASKYKSYTGSRCRGLY